MQVLLFTNSLVWRYKITNYVKPTDFSRSVLKSYDIRCTVETNHDYFFSQHEIDTLLLAV